MQADPQMHPIRYTAACADGIGIACFRFANPGGVPVIVVHGTFSSHEGCIGLARRLADDGLDVWAMDWRGRGGSDQPKQSYDFDTVAEFDIPSVMDLVKAETGHSSAYFVTHSGGGLVVAMWAARNPKEANQKIRGLVTMAAQAHLAADPPEHHKRIADMSQYLATVDVIPRRQFGVGSEPESARLMRQWCRWNLERSFVGPDGFDYVPALGQVQIPLLSMVAAGDTFVAPQAGCEAFTNCFGSTDRKIVVCGREQGFLEDYDHGRILASSAAARDVWPFVAKWIEDRVQI